MVARRADLSPDASGGKPQPRHQRAHSARFVIEPLPDPALSFRCGPTRTATASTALAGLGLTNCEANNGGGGTDHQEHPIQG